MGNKDIKIEKTDLDELVKLYSKAKNTPMIKMTSDPKEKDWATIAWDDVKDFQKKLGNKYNFDWEKNIIDSTNGNVMSIGMVEQNG